MQSACVLRLTRASTSTVQPHRFNFRLPFLDDRRVRRPLIRTDLEDPAAAAPSCARPAVPAMYSEHGPLPAVRAHVHAPEWDLTKPSVGERARSNAFNLNDDKWTHLNKVVWPARMQIGDDEPKPRELFHNVEDIKYSPQKMWMVCEFIRGRAVDDAIAQLQLIPRKGPIIMIECLQEAKSKCAEHEIEYASNTWIAEASCTNSNIVYGARRHKGSVVNKIRYRYTSVYLRLQEGPPPPYFGRDEPETGWTKMADYVQQLRSRKIRQGL